LVGLGAEHYLAEREHIKAVTLEEVRTAASRYFGQQSVTVVASPLSHEQERQ
jgi:predicted Zn-dependent peptidase